MKVQAMPSTTLKELRKSRGLTQKEMGTRLKLDQSAIVKIERRTNQNMATIRKFIDALGGEMCLVARFPEGDYALADLLDADDE